TRVNCGGVRFVPLTEVGRNRAIGRFNEVVQRDDSAAVQHQQFRLVSKAQNTICIRDMDNTIPELSTQNVKFAIGQSFKPVDGMVVVIVLDLKYRAVSDPQ